MKIKRGDKVKVIAGDDKGTVGSVIKVLPKENRVVVEGVNICKKHRKPSQANPDGAIEEFAAPINASNVQLVENPRAKKNVKVVRVGYKVVDGKKVRYSHKADKALD